MAKLVPYSNKAHKDQFFDLNVEYVTWVSKILKEIHNIDLGSSSDRSVQEYVTEYLEEYINIEPHTGIVFILEIAGRAEGMGALMQLEPGIGEIKRMFIRPTHRGQNFGRLLLTKLIEKGKELGFSRLRLETSETFKAARHLYKSMGFHDIRKYRGGETPPQIQKHVKYMELIL
ncbi:MAG: GNAT family N-acetyltransferase [Candidatus Thorarchaeota archaeon]